MSIVRKFLGESVIDCTTLHARKLTVEKILPEARTERAIIIQHSSILINYLRVYEVFLLVRLRIPEHCSQSFLIDWRLKIK